MEIDAAFWQMLTNAENQTLLLGHSARIVDIGGDWGLTGVMSGTYIHAMGLQNNDIFLEINGVALTGTLHGIEDAIADVGDASACTFKVRRARITRTHTYTIN